MHITLNSHKNAAEESTIGKLFSAFDNIIAKEGPSTDPNDKYIKPFYGEEVETFFDSLIRRFKAAVARTRVPQRYIPAFDAYVQFYNMEEKHSAGQSEGNGQFLNNAGFKAATAVRNYFAIMLGNELGGPESSLAIRSYDDVHPMVAVVDKNDPGRNPHLEVKVYSPAGDGNFKIAYKGRNIPDSRVDCPEDANGLEALARDLAGMIKPESFYEKLEYEKGHKNSKGEDAPWVIRSHVDGRILASFAKKDDAEKHLARMKSYADKP